MWRAVTRATSRAEPARLAGVQVIADELAGDGNNDDVVHHQRGAREAPVWDLRVSASERGTPVSVGRRIVRPYDGAISGVERVQDSGCTEGVDPTIAEGRRRARA